MKPRALFICGSRNQTTQMHAVARALPDVHASFTPFYGDRVVDWMRRSDLIENTIGGNKLRGICLRYLHDNHLSVDMHGVRGGYDLVVTCTDLVVPKNTRRAPLVVVQEGIMDRDNFAAALCRAFPQLPRWFAGTALTGESSMYERFCVASRGYRDKVVRRGADPRRIVVTGIPNFDDCERYRKNDFPHRDYVLVCTSDLRETFQGDRRDVFLRRALDIAANRKLIFKLHPNEKHDRAEREIRALAPNALVFRDGSAEEMIANASVLVTQWSSTVFVGMALGKEVHSNYPALTLQRLMPWQNGGTSAKRIASVCREVLGMTDPESTDPEFAEPPSPTATAHGHAMWAHP